MRTIFESYGWSINEFHSDYGIDFEVEVFKKEESTGIAFKVQLKSSIASKYSSTDEYISQPLETSNALYLCQELRVPVILIHADVEKNRTFWTAPQLDRLVCAKLSEKKKPATITFRIPVENELPKTIDQLISAVAQAEKVLLSRQLLSLDTHDFVSSISGHINRDDLIRNFQNKGDLLKIERAYEYFQTYNFKEAHESITNVINNTESTVEVRFEGLILLENIEIVTAIKADTPQDRIPKIHLNISNKLKKLTQKGPPPHKFFALIARKASELDYLVHIDYGLSMNFKLHRKEPDPLWYPVLTFKRAAIYRKIIFKYNQCLRLVRYTTRSRHRWLLPRAILKIVNSIAPFCLKLNQEGFIEESKSYEKSALELCKLAASISKEIGDENGIVNAISMALMLSRDPNSDNFTWARKTIEDLTDENEKRSANSQLSNHLRRISGERLPDDVITTERQVYENMAASLGIDMSNPNAIETKLINIGINDLDFGKVLKNCENLFITIDPMPPLILYLANILKLPTIGSKTIHCTLHKFQISGDTIDEAYKRFKEEYCNKCENCVVRPESWKFTRKWQVEEENKFRENE